MEFGECRNAFVNDVSYGIHVFASMASTTQSARELAEVQQSCTALNNTMIEIRRFLEYTPKTEDQIKSMLRALDGNQTKHMEKLQLTVSTLIKECTKAT